MDNMSLKRLIKRTAVGSIALSDYLTGLVSELKIGDDVECAMQTVPIILPVNLPSWSDNKAIALLNNEFSHWYKNADAMLRLTIGLESTSYKYETFDTLIEHYHEGMDLNDILNRYRQQLNRTIASARNFNPQKFLTWFEPWESVQKSLDKEIIHYRKFNTCFLRKEIKKTVKRSYELLRSLTTDADKFIKGNLLIVEGCRFYYGLRLQPYTLLAYTMDPPKNRIPFDLQIFDRGFYPLASGCIYFDKTPILDQAAAVILHVMTPDDELDFIKTTIWSRMTRHYVDSELASILNKKYPIDDSPEIPVNLERDPTQTVAQHNQQVVEVINAIRIILNMDDPGLQQEILHSITTDVNRELLQTQTSQGASLRLCTSDQVCGVDTQYYLPQCSPDNIPYYSTNTMVNISTSYGGLVCTSDLNTSTTNQYMTSRTLEAIRQRVKFIENKKILKECLLTELRISDKARDYFLTDRANWYVLQKNVRDNVIADADAVNTTPDKLFVSAGELREAKLAELEKFMWIVDEPIYDDVLSVDPSIMEI